MAIGEALARASRLAAATGELALASPPAFLPLMPSSGLEFAAAVAVFAAGVAALPHLLPLSATVAGAGAARRMVAWSLVLVMVVALMAPVYAAFARLAILTAVSQSAALPEWMIAFGKPGFVQTCGSDAASLEAIRAACLAVGRTRIGATDIAINGDAIVLAWPDIVGLPKLMGALVGVGALAAAVAAASAMAFAMGVLVGHDLYGRVLSVRSSAGRGLFASRIGMIAATLAGAWLGATYRQDVFALAFTGISLPAAGLFPALVLAVWWKRTNAWGAAAGILAGFTVTAAIIVDRRYPGLLPPSPVDLTALAMPELTAAIVGMPVALVVTIVVSLITPRPSAERRAVLDRIRGARPRQPVEAAA
jgi:cation/acetate symporter